MFLYLTYVLVLVLSSLTTAYSNIGSHRRPLPLSMLGTGTRAVVQSVELHNDSQWKRTSLSYPSLTFLAFTALTSLTLPILVQLQYIGGIVGSGFPCFYFRKMCPKRPDFPV